MGDGAADAEQLSEPTGPTERKRDWPLVVRRARDADKAAVLEFASDTWDGWDYIPHAWPVWLAATDGVMLVGCRPGDDRPIALTRVAMVSPTEAWWEGIRVDPAVRGMEVAADLQVAELHWTAAQGAKYVRYATSARNEGSHRLGARDGIELLCEYRNYWWSPEPGDPHDPSAFDPAVRAQASSLRARVLAALAAEGRILKKGQADTQWAVTGLGFVTTLYEPRPWAMGSLTWERFRRHVDRGEVIQFDEEAVAILLREQLAGEDSSLRLAYVNGVTDFLLELVERVVALAGDNTVRFRLQAGEESTERSHEDLIAAGFQTGEWNLHILGRPIDSDHPVPDLDPNRLVLADPPQPIIKPLGF